MKIEDAPERLSWVALLKLKEAIEMGENSRIRFEQRLKDAIDAYEI